MGKNTIFPCLVSHLFMRVKGDCLKVRRPMRLTLRFNKKTFLVSKQFIEKFLVSTLHQFLPTNNFLPVLFHRFAFGVRNSAFLWTASSCLVFMQTLNSKRVQQLQTNKQTISNAHLLRGIMS